MIPHRLAIVWIVLVLLAGCAVDGKTETLPRSVDQAIDHTGDTRPYFTGRIEQDTTWRDTVYVGGDVTIAAEATLTLAPNTQVHFLPYRDATRGGLDSTRAELIVEGRLAAYAGGIVFRSADAGSLGADWYGLVVERGGRADVSNAVIRDGLRCVYAKRGGRVTMDALAFANCGKPTTPEDAARLAMSRKRTQPLPALRVAEKTDRPKRVDRVAGKSYAKTEPAEITIYIPGGHKGVVLALLEAVDEGTPITGIAELDSLATTYGLMGIYRTGGRSSGLYGYRFRLTFPPGADVAAMAKAYGTYTEKMARQRSMWVDRVAGKLVAGPIAGVATFYFGNLLIPSVVCYPVGVGLGTSLADGHDYFRSLAFSLGGSFLGFGMGLALINRDILFDNLFLSLTIPSSIMATLASELFRKPPESGRFSVSLVPDIRGNWSAVATLRF